MSALKRSVKVKRALLVYPGNRRFKHASGAEALPVQDLSKEISQGFK